MQRKAPFRCSFKPSGEGHIIMTRTRNSDDAPAPGYNYTRDGVWPAVSALTARERREWKAAVLAEWGLHNDKKSA